MPTEKEQIDVIGKYIMDAPKSSADKPLIVGCVVEDQAKAERFIKLFKKHWPKVRVLDTSPSINNTILIRLGEPLR